MGVLTGKTDEQEHIEWDELRARAAIEAPLRKRIAELEAETADLHLHLDAAMRLLANADVMLKQKLKR